MNLIFSGEALALVRESRLRKPCVKVGLDYKPPVCTSSYCRKRPHVRLDIVEEDFVEEGYARITSDSGIVVYMSYPLFDLAKRENQTMKIKTRGWWGFTRLVIEGLDPYEV